MKTFKYFIFLMVIGLMVSCGQQSKHKTVKRTDANGYAYETVTGDPMKTRIYTLDNGLKVYLSVNKDEPRIQTIIAVRAGSTFDPPETTGLAHYFEHMMFKGTDEIGTIDWENEQIMVAKISDLFEQRRAESDPAKKLTLYRQIDSLSGLAAEFAVANEYDKMVSALGAKGTNAGTSYEMTVYLNNIPSNQFERWLKLESERFSGPVLRLFHTELETVYEEFNMSQDNDNRKVNYAMLSGLFQKHPLGTQTVLGKPEHLKNPSMVNIMNYFDAYYRPNNIAFCLSGDLEYEKTIELIDQYFGEFEPNDSIPEFVPPVEDPITEPIVKHVVGPQAESVRIGFRFDGVNTPDEKYVTLIDNILSNSQAGLIDLDLNQQQKVLRAGAYASFFIDYGMHVFYGMPRQGQGLEEVKDLLLVEIEKIKNGEFDDWLIQAVINDLRLSEIYQQESNYRAYSYMSAFIQHVDWADQVAFIDELEKITKQELIDFANKHYKDNYVVVYKETGKDTTSVKLEKPPLTPIELNREAQSEFLKEFVEDTPEKLEPVFLDFTTAIEKTKLKDKVELDYIPNKTNELFTLAYIIDMGKNHLKELPIAVNYLPYLGTDKYSPAELQQEFFKLGLRMNVSTGNDRSYVTISGLDKSFEAGIQLLEHVLANVKPDQAVYGEYVDGIIKQRADAKLNKSTILWSALMNFGRYGKISPFTNIFSEEELQSMDPDLLTSLVKDIYSYEHQVFYYGPRKLNDVEGVLAEHHQIRDQLQEYPPEFEFIEQPTDKNLVYFVDYDMVQVNVVGLSKDGPFDRSLIPPARLFGEYYGSGLSSIVFQDIREARGLAYSAFASFSVPGKLDRSNYVYTYVATQADKLKEATSAMLELMSTMPEAPVQFESAKEAILTKIETERITKANIFWTYLSNKERGIDYDIRRDVYDYTQTATIEKFETFFNEYIKDRNYIYLIIGNRDLVDMNQMKKLGKVKELSLEEIFNY